MDITSSPTVHKGRIFAWAFVTYLVVLVSDQLSKQWALASLKQGEVIPIFGDFLSFQLVFNSGAAFSLGESVTWVFTIFSLVILIFLAYFAVRSRSFMTVISIAILAGGATGNLIDRLFRPPAFGVGHVVDFISYNGWFVGNVADIWIVVAVLLLVFLTVREKEPPVADETPENTLSDGLDAADERDNG